MFNFTLKKMCELFVEKKIILYAKGGDFEIGAWESDCLFLNIKPYKSKKHIT